MKTCTLAMVSRCIRLAVGSLVLCFASSAVAQERGKSLYASQCERCHKTPQDVTTFHGGVDLETFLAQLHYADTQEAATAIAAYLKGLERKRRKTEHGAKTNPSAPSPRVPSNGDSNENLTRTLKRLFGGANP